MDRQIYRYINERIKKMINKDKFKEINVGDTTETNLIDGIISKSLFNLLTDQLIDNWLFLYLIWVNE